MAMFSALSKGQPSAAPKDYAQELGWKSQWSAEGTIYTGFYRAVGLRYQGWIFKQRDEKLTFYILKPPIDLIRSTDFSGCFHARNGDWWLITFKPYALPADIASGIAAIQKTLCKAFEVRTARRRGQS